MAEFQQDQIFDFRVFDSTTYMVSIHVGSYRNNNNVYIGMITREDGFTEPFGDISVNIDKLPPFHAALDTNNLPHVAEFVEIQGLGKPTGIRLTSGFCTYPVYEFDRDALRALDPAGCAEYEKDMSSPEQANAVDIAKDLARALGGEVAVMELGMEMQ